MKHKTPLDIASYLYCPILYYQGRSDRITKPLTLTEECTKRAFIEGERSALLKESIVTPRKFSAAWDKIWWPAATRNNISMKRAQQVTLRSTLKFGDYCRYDISDYMCPTVGVDIESSKSVGNIVLRARADVIKMDFDSSGPNTMLINFIGKSITLQHAALDPAIRATAYAFYRNENETITHVSIDISESSKNLSILTSTFRPKDMDGIRKLVYHVGHGISNNISYSNPYLCKECKACPSSRL